MKNIVLAVLLIVLVISGISNIILLSIDLTPQSKEDPPDFVIGTYSGPHTLELVDSWDRDSNIILEQVVETLFSYDLYDLDLPRINRLAYSYWWENSTKLHIRLREGIVFHDDTPFNAEAAKWNLDRLQYLTNNTGTNFGEVAHTQSLWMFPGGERFIMNSTTTQGEFNITITLNGPYSPFLNTLAYINAGMISPTAHAKDEKSFIDLTNGDVVGTGPFIFDRYKPNVEVTLSRWDKYWRKPANFNKIVFAILPDATSQNNAFLSYTVDILIDVFPSFIPYYENDTHLTVKHFTDDTGIPGLQYHYLGFNNKKYNATWRKVFSYAINYTYIIEELQGGNVIRANSPISPAFGNSHNSSSQGADYNLTKAREVMQSMGFGVGYTTDQEWIDHALSTGGKTPFLTLTYQYNAGGSFREGMFIAVNNWFKLIGLYIAEDACTWGNFLNYLLDDHDHLGLFAIGWGPDYFDLFNMLDPLINPNSSWNSAQVNDTTLIAMMNLALETTNDAARNNIYKDIQGYFSEVGYFHAPLYHPKITYVHGANIYGVPYNAMERFEVYGIWRGLYPK